THASKVTFYQETGTMRAEGKVRSTDFSAKSGAQLSNGPVNLSSEHLEANSIELLRDTHVLNAVGSVQGVFPQAPAADAASKQPTLWHVSSGKLTYLDVENRARLEENVVVQSVDQKMRASMLDLFFTRGVGGKEQGAS